MLTRIFASLAMLAAILSGGPVEAARSGPVVAVGDSIVYGVGTSDPENLSWPGRNGYVKVGTSGGCVIATCFGRPPMVDVYDSAVLAHGPSVVVIAYGINDIASGQVGAAQIVDGLAELMWRARATGATAYVTTLTPVGPGMGMLDPGRRDVNARIRARFRNVIDTEAPLLNRNTGMLKWAYDSGDNLHPNPDGYREMAAAVRAGLR